MVDIAISIAIASLTLVLAGMGIHVTLHPIDPLGTGRQNRYKAAFTLCAIAMVGLIGWQGARSKHSQEALTTALAKIEHNTQTPPQVFNNVPPAQVVVEPPNVQTTKPEPASISYEVRPAPSPANAVSIIITVHGTVRGPAFEAFCEEACTLTSMQTLAFGAFLPHILPNVNATTVSGRFVVPAAITDGQQCILDVNSEDGNLVHIKNVKIIAHPGRDAK